MSITVRQLTDDGSFLFTLAPEFAPAPQNSKFPGSFTILLDPWLAGRCVVLHPKFASTQHVSKAAITSLADIEQDIDLIIISQDKADHLHRETLCTLPKNTNVRILAPSKAAKLIREWRYFDNPNIVGVLNQYSTKRSDSVISIPLAPYSSASAKGEVTIANIGQRKDLVGLHNAIAVTYRPPGAQFTASDGSIVSLADMPMVSKFRQAAQNNPRLPAPLKERFPRRGSSDAETFKPNNREAHVHEVDVDSSRPMLTHSCTDPTQRRPSAGSLRRMTEKSTTTKETHAEKVLSVIYTPHGIEASSLQPYIVNHLSPLKGALPVTTLVHSLTYESNPWWLGGVICAGTPCGVRIAQEIGVRYWLSAHDGAKDTAGLATKWMTSMKYDAQEATKMLKDANGSSRGNSSCTEVITLRAGEARRFKG